MNEEVAIAQALDRWTEKVGRQFGPLSRGKRRMLLAVAAGSGGVRVSDLAARLDVTPAGATRMIDTLEKLGYVQRFQRPDTDQRQVHVALTPSGATALEAANRAFAESVRTTLAGLSAEDLGRLAALLQRLSSGSGEGRGLEALTRTPDHAS